MALRFCFLAGSADNLIVVGETDGAIDGHSVVVALGPDGEMLAEAPALPLPTPGSFAARLPLVAREAVAALSVGEAVVEAASVAVQPAAGRLSATEDGLTGWIVAPAGPAPTLTVERDDGPTLTVVGLTPIDFSDADDVTASTFELPGASGGRLMADGAPIDAPAASGDHDVAGAAAAEEPSLDEPVMAEPATAPSGRLEGSFDNVEDGGWAAGWARYADGGGKAMLAVFIDGRQVGEVVADQFREDLQRSGFADPSCAFWYGITEEWFDGEPHEIELRDAATGQPLPGSPRGFTLAPLRAVQAAEHENLIPNAQFLEWPSGIAVSPRDRFAEPLAGWYFDFRRGTQPNITLSVENGADLALPPLHYAMRVTVGEGTGEGFMRLIVPVEASAADLSRCTFSLGVRRPPNAPDSALHVGEVFLATVDNGTVARVSTIRRNLRPRGTSRVIGVRAVSDPELLAAVEPRAQLAVAIDLKGEGSMLLFAPELTMGAPTRPMPAEVDGDFEDGNIRSQAEQLQLSPIWRTREMAVATARPGEAPVSASARAPSRGQSAMPFIPIVVPVFNAAADVEDCLRSIVSVTDSPFEVVLFDDGSEEFAQARISRWEAIDPRVRYLRHRENVGYTRNINVALQSTVSDFVVLLNSDTVVTPGWLRKLYETATADERTAAAGPLSNAASWQSVPRTKSPAGEWVVNAFDADYPPARIAALVERLSDGATPAFPLLNGFCTLFRRAALEQVGWFDDASFPRGYGEENDLCLRLGQAGWTLRVATDAYVHHSKSKSFGTAQRKELSKQANAILRGKHPAVSFPEVEELMRGDPSVNAVRRGLAQVLGVELGQTLS